MKIISHKATSDLTKEVEREELTPEFYAHSVKASLMYLSVVLKDGTTQGNYILQVNGKTGKLLLVEQQRLKEAPIYSADKTEELDDDE